MNTGASTFFSSGFLMWTLLFLLIALIGTSAAMLVSTFRRNSRMRGLEARLQAFSALSDNSVRQLQALDSLQKIVLDQNQANRSELQDGLNRYQIAMLSELRNLTQNIEARLVQMEKKTAQVGEQVDSKLERIRTDNEQRLEQMRKTVDERLQTTLEQRLGDSFKLVSDQLEVVHRSLGEMQNLPSEWRPETGVTNIKTRGNWGGEVQVDIARGYPVPDQYDKNVATKEGSSDRVAFASGYGREAGVPASHPFWLPVDAS
jgi:DNA recombination protein RmuC